MSVLDKIVKNKRLPVLFIGAGIPKRYIDNFPSWNQLLEESFYTINDDPYYYRGHVDRIKREGLSDFEKNKRLGTIVEDDFNNAFYMRKISLQKDALELSFRSDYSPYKLFLQQRFSEYKLIDSLILKEEIRELHQLKNKVSAVITTNYDTFIEDNILGDDFSVFFEQHQLFSNESYNISELYKIHGTVESPDSIILTEKDYEKFDLTRRLFIAKMLILFTESPIIFLGYSFTDENIQAIVSDFMQCLTLEQLQNIHENFIFISYKEGESKLVESKRTMILHDKKTMTITEIETDNFLSVYQAINKLVPGMTPKNIRDTQRLVKKIVNNSLETGNSSNIIMGIDEVPDDISDKNIAIAIGPKSDIVNQYGYTLISDKDIFEDILLDNKNLDPNKMCSERFKSLPSSRLMPVFKYVKNCTIPLTKIPKLEKFVSCRDETTKIITENIKRKNLKYLETYNDIRSAESDFDTHQDINKLFGGILKSVDILSITDLKEICVKYLKSHTEEVLKNTHFKRVIMYIDFIENYKKNAITHVIDNHNR